MNQIVKVLKSSTCKVTVLACALAYVAAAPQAIAATKNESVTAPTAQQLKIVPSLGYTYFNIQGSPADFKSKGGSSAAVLVQMPMMEGQMELESGVEYLETGARRSVDFGVLSFTTSETTVGQLAVPLRAKYIINPTAQGTRWYGKAGLTPTFLMSAKTNDLGVTVDEKSNMNGIGVFTQAGFGADWAHDLIPGRVSMDFTYSYGLTKVFKNEDGRAAGFQLQAGYVISL